MIGIKNVKNVLCKGRHISVVNRTNSHGVCVTFFQRPLKNMMRTDSL